MGIQTFKLERYFAKYEFNSRYLLSASDCETLTIGELLELTDTDPKDMLDVGLGYTESQGHPKLLDEISNLYDLISSKNSITLTGAEEGIFKPCLLY